MEIISRRVLGTLAFALLVSAPASRGDDKLAFLIPHLYGPTGLVVDSGWFFADKEQTVNVCDIRINQSTVFPCQGQPGEKPGEGKGRKKVKMCHNGHTITVGQPAVKAHLKHGDTMGPCTAAQKKAAKKKHHHR